MIQGLIYPKLDILGQKKSIFTQKSLEIGNCL